MRSLASSKARLNSKFIFLRFFSGRSLVCFQRAKKSASSTRNPWQKPPTASTNRHQGGSWCVILILTHNRPISYGPIQNASEFFLLYNYIGCLLFQSYMQWQLHLNLNNIYCASCFFFIYSTTKPRSIRRKLSTCELLLFMKKICIIYVNALIRVYIFKVDRLATDSHSTPVSCCDIVLDEFIFPK